MEASESQTVIEQEVPIGYIQAIQGDRILFSEVFSKRQIKRCMLRQVRRTPRIGKA